MASEKQILPGRAYPRYYWIDDTGFALTVHEPQPKVPEALVQDLWRHQRFAKDHLTTVDGRPVKILDPGEPNTDRGPDFLNAVLHIDGVEWRGAVEIHVQSGGWYAHQHHKDEVYNSVVLHVSLYPDVWTGGLCRADTTTIPEITLADKLRQPLRSLLHHFLTSDGDKLPCASQWKQVPESLRQDYTLRLGRQRLVEKARRMGARYQAEPFLKNLLFYEVARALGYSRNTDPMLLLAQRIPLHAAHQLREDAVALDALFLGTAGLIPSPDELTEAPSSTQAYASLLRRTFAQLSGKHNIQQLDSNSWQFFRLRPANFPPLRVAQLAALFQSGGLFDGDTLGRLAEDLACERPVSAWEETLLATGPPSFWNHHFTLTSSTSKRSPAIGATRRKSIVSNAFVPVLILHAEQEGLLPLRAELLSLVDALPPESDSVTRQFPSAPKTRLQSQGYHQLYRTKCTLGGCLSCQIGKHLISEGE